MSAIPGTKPSRILSVDMLRGLTIFVMIFANFGFMGSPWFMRHYDHRAFSGVTYVDYVFGVFLVLVGVSIPLAFRKYGDTWRENSKAAWHILLRGASMLFIGLLLINTPNLEKMGDWSFMHRYWALMGFEEDAFGWLAQDCWRVLVVTGVVLLFAQILVDDYRFRWLQLGLRALGAGILIFYMARFVPANIIDPLSERYLESPWYRQLWRCVMFNEGNWLRGGWWEIIGLIGWGYMGGALMYLFVRKTPEFIYLALFFMFMVSVSGKFQRFEGMEYLARFAPGIGHYSMFTLLGAGLGAAMLRCGHDHKLMLKMLFRGLILMLLLSALTTPLAGLSPAAATGQDLWEGSIYRFFFGLGKNGATLGWLFTTGVVCLALWIIFYLLIDVWKRDNFLIRFLCNVGSVPLTAYIFQFLFFALIRATGWLRFPADYSMATSLAVCLVVTVGICYLAVFCKKHKFTIKL